MPNFQSDDEVPLERERNGHRHSQSFSIESDMTGHTFAGPAGLFSHDSAFSAAGAGVGSELGGGSGSRDSISLASESSDDDLHTASIISLTPVMGRKMVDGALGMGIEVGSDRREEMIVDEVGLAL